MRDQTFDLHSGIERLKHVVPDEVVQVVDRFHRHRLMEEFHGLLGLDVQPPPEISPILAEAGVWLDACGEQSTAQRGDVGAEAGEVVGDGQSSVGDDEESRGLGLLAILDREAPGPTSQSDRTPH